MNSKMLGIGLGVDNCAHHQERASGRMQRFGDGRFRDGKEISYTNITEVNEGDPFYVEKLKVHILVKGCKYHLENRLMMEPWNVHRKIS